MMHLGVQTVSVNRQPDSYRAGHPDTLCLPKSQHMFNRIENTRLILIMGDSVLLEPQPESAMGHR